MIRNVPTGAAFSFRGRMGAAGGAAGLTSLESAGISAGVSLATTAASLWMNSIQLSHSADTATTQIANGLATQFQNLLAAYMSEPHPTCSDQRAALDAFDQALLWFEGPNGCGNGSYGSAGNRCVSERATAGAKYSYVDAFRTPIANDPRLAGAGCDTGNLVILPTVSGGYQTTNITSTGGSGTTGATAAQIAAAAVAATSPPPNYTPVAGPDMGVASPPAPTTSPNYVLIGAAAIGALLLAKAL